MIDRDFIADLDQLLRCRGYTIVPTARIMKLSTQTMISRYEMENFKDEETLKLREYIDRQNLHKMADDLGKVSLRTVDVDKRTGNEVRRVDLKVIMP